MTAIEEVTSGVCDHYGVKLTPWGEDGATLIFGHHEPRRVAAVLAKHWRWCDGLTVGEYGTLADVLPRISAPLWCTFSEHSEGCELVNCGHRDEMCEACQKGDHAACAGDECECADGLEYDPHDPALAPDGGCLMCECYCDEYAWWGEFVKPEAAGRPGVHPVMEFRP